LKRRAKTKPSRNRSVFAQRLSLTFALIAAMTAVLAGVITYVTWSLAFENYIRRNLQSTATYVAQHAGSAYYLFGGWDFSHRTMIPQVATRQDILVQIFDNTNRLIYDESVFNPPVRSEQDESLALQNIDALSSQDYNVITAPIIVDYIRVGEVRVLARGETGLLTPHDLEMRATSLTALGAAGFFAIIVSTGIGMWYSRRLVIPIAKVTSAAARVREGDESARANLRGDDEIAQLGITFDQMAESIQRDRARERQMAGDVAHELRTPLMGIQATVEAIEDGIYPADKEHLSIILNETHRLTGLTNSLLELSRLESQKTEFPMSVIDINEPIKASVSVNMAVADAAGLKMDQALTPRLYVNANSARLQQAFTNLLTNSIRYTPEGGTVTVHSYVDAEYACVAIQDTGIGMSEEEVENVFGRFWRADYARDRVAGGVGIGLPITKEIVDRHKGVIKVHSVEGEGTVFTVCIPLAH